MKARTQSSAPTFGDHGYPPMVDLLRYLEGYGFTNYIASGGDRDFMRPVDFDEIYGIPTDRVMAAPTPCGTDRRDGGSRRLPRRTGRVRRRADKACSDLEPNRAPANHRRGQRERRHPDAPATQVVPTVPPYASLSSTTTAEREFDYAAGAERALELAPRTGLDRRQHPAGLGARSSPGRRRCPGQVRRHHEVSGIALKLGMNPK